MRRKDSHGSPLELWGGLECTVNRVGDRFCDQFEKGGHLERPEDLDLVADLGIRRLRYPILWERTAPNAPEERDWSLADGRLARLRHRQVAPIVGLVHHGSGPRYTNLVDEGFASGLAAHARAVAERYPWVDAYTPVNEPLTTARFSGLYGHWYPHGTDEQTFSRALIHQVKATVLSMAAIREVNPQAKLVQTDDLGKTHATSRLRHQAEFENERRWITWDLLCGRVDREHRMWRHLLHFGVGQAELEWFLENPCPPDVVGINHYLTSERFLDHRQNRYPEHTHGSNGMERYADVEAIRVLAGGIEGAAGLLREAWERYGLQMAITECHLGCTREEQARWLLGVWRQAQTAKAEGIDVRAVTVWSMFGAYDWCSLLTKEEGRYEPGVFDLRAPKPRPTALAGVIRSIVDEEDSLPETFHDDGWWERPIRLLYEPVVSDVRPTPIAKGQRETQRPLLIVGANGTLGQAFAHLCDLRGIDFRLVSREEMDLARPSSVAAGLARHRPWAVINAAGYTDVDRAEVDVTACWRDNATGPVDLAKACADRNLPLLYFSCGMVFEGTKAEPYVESDLPRPRNLYGRSKLVAEKSILSEHPGALVVRSGPLFGPWCRKDTVMEIVRHLVAEHIYEASDEVVVSPTFVPDLVHASLDLLLDGMTGLIHLANGGEISWLGFARRIAEIAGLDPSMVESRPPEELGWKAPRPAYAALASERAWIMPPLENALERLSADLRLRDKEAVGNLPYLR